jgi:hypothetical protein
MASVRTYVRQPGYVAANLGEELAVLDMAKGSYLGFNATAAQIWRLLDTPRTLDALCQALLLEFEIEDERCRADVTALLDRLAAAGMVRIEDGEVA